MIHCSQWKFCPIRTYVFLQLKQFSDLFNLTGWRFSLSTLRRWSSFPLLYHSGELGLGGFELLLTTAKPLQSLATWPLCAGNCGLVFLWTSACAQDTRVREATLRINLTSETTQSFWSWMRGVNIAWHYFLGGSLLKWFLFWGLSRLNIVNQFLLLISALKSHPKAENGDGELESKNVRNFSLGRSIQYAQQWHWWKCEVGSDQFLPKCIKHGLAVGSLLVRIHSCQLYLTTTQNSAICIQPWSPGDRLYWSPPDVSLS